MRWKRTTAAGVVVTVRVALAAVVFSSVACAAEPDDGAAASASTTAVASPPASATSAPTFLPTDGVSPEAAGAPPPWRDRPRPARARGDEAVRANAACEGCHAVEAKAWRASQHRSAYVDAPFQHALAAEPSGFCRGCHAPEAEPRRATAQRAHDVGVGCVSCHLDDAGAVLAIPRDGVDDARAPHAIVRAAGMATEEACASCHEFAFPGDRGSGDGGFMQTTLREHSASPSASRPCAGCHMPIVGGRRDHGFASVRDPAWLRDALRVEAARGPGGTITVTLEQKLAGHAFPTGDLFRRLEVGARYRGGDRTSHDVDHLARHFVLEEGKPGRTLALDDRLLFEPVIVELHLDGLEAPPSGARVDWWVKLQRVATPLRGNETERAIVESEVPLFEGTLRPEVNP